MNKPHLLEKHVGKLVTSMGAFIPGERVVFRGQNLHTTLKDLNWVELYLFAITGRHFTANQVDVIQALWCYTSYPDARIWNNRVAALAGSARSTGTLGISAAMAVSEAKIYGRGVDLRASEFFRRIKKLVDAGKDLRKLVQDELAQKRGIAGYGRPLVSKDERIDPMIELIRERNLDDGPHLKIAFEVEKILLEGRWRLHLNYAALAAALCADFGMSSNEYYFASFMAFLAGMPPCFLDASEKLEGQFLPLSCRMLSYEGVPNRSWQNKSYNVISSR